jgi:hypothetical protein
VVAVGTGVTLVKTVVIIFWDGLVAKYDPAATPAEKATIAIKIVPMEIRLLNGLDIFHRLLYAVVDS